MCSNTRSWTFSAFDVVPVLMENIRRTTGSIPWTDEVLSHLCHTIALSMDGEMHEVLDIVDISWKWNDVKPGDEQITVNVTIEASCLVPNVGPVS